MTEAEPLQQVRRTYVRYRRQTLSYFGGCDYFRLASHPDVLAAVSQGLRRYGLNVAASRTTSGNHEVYLKLEQELAHFFQVEAALLTNSGYITSLIAAQALAGQFSHALIDERAHAALQDAVEALNCPVLKFKHRAPADFAQAVQRCGKAARIIALTDGMFSHDGSVAPLQLYLKLLPRDGLLLVDDAHGAGTLGQNGRGSIELAGISRQRVIQCVTLSKAFGVYGGAILGSRKLRTKLTQSRAFVGSTPIPLPLAFAAAASLRLLGHENSFRERLNQNAAFTKTSLGRVGLELPDLPGPIIPLHFNAPAQSKKLKRALLAARILPPLIHYPGAPANGYFRFVISSEHTRSQLANLVRTLTPFLKHAAN
jgi:7-keto-8-aminopelargonate synthetase-like enzyme